MKIARWLIAVVMVSTMVTAIMTGCTSDNPAAAAGEGTQVNISSQQEGIWVTGQGKVTAVPDIAVVRLGIEAQDTSVASAQAQAKEAMDKVMEALADSGIAQKDIQTQYFNIYQVTRWDRDTEEEVVTGYRVSNMVSAKVRDTDKVGTIIDAVVQAGGDFIRINGVSFSVDDPTDYYEDARKEAVANAKAKAEQLASLAGVKLGKATYIAEGSTGTTYPVLQAGGMAFAEETMVSKTSISPGEMELSLTVQVGYSIID